MTMNSHEATNLPTARIWAGRILSGLIVVLLAVDAGGKLFAPATMIAHSLDLQLPAQPDFYRLLGAILAICIAIYAWPRTAVLGAVLLTGYLGGAIATQMRIGAPLFSHILFGVYVGIVVWGGLLLRRPDVARFLGIAPSGR